MQELIELANKLADEAGIIARQYFRQPFSVESKSDETPVTIADRAIEKRMREIIESERPDDGILGEEFSIKESKNGYVWVLDPIDGTKSFIVGRPTFGTLIALCKDDVPVLGVVDQPISKERWVGAEGHQTTFNGQTVQTRPCSSLKEACFSTTSPAYLPMWAGIRERCALTVWGGDCYSYALLASGNIDMIIESGLAPHDFAALVPVIHQAGGLICDWAGQPLSLKSDGCIIALGDPALKDQALALLNE
ncbi:MAG: histidinol-phosphatase [Rhodospirillales bacterium]|nr:histidinol-phosphatase [Rhodospirillales bacterium]